MIVDCGTRNVNRLLLVMHIQVFHIHILQLNSGTSWTKIHKEKLATHKSHVQWRTRGGGGGGGGGGGAPPPPPPPPLVVTLLVFALENVGGGIFRKKCV